MRPSTEIALDDWKRVLDVDVGGVFLMCRGVVPHLREQGEGKIVNIASGSFFRGVPFILHYVTSKGVIGLTRALARELGPDNICVNAIAPGYTINGATLEQDEPHVQAGARAVDAHAIRREQRPTDVVGSAVFPVWARIQLQSPGSRLPSMVAPTFNRPSEVNCAECCFPWHPLGGPSGCPVPGRSCLGPCRGPHP